ncbi:hypothetical protein T4E_3339, partial [Trichinella pseudospiralis]
LTRQRRQNCVPPPWIEDAELNRLSSHDQHPTITSHVEISTGGDESLSQGAVVVELTKRNMQIFISPQAMPQAMPQAEYQKFRIFQNIASGFALRRCPRANKNLHIPSGHASEFSEFFRNLAPGVAPGYAAGLVKICIFSQAALEGIKNLHILPSGYALSSLRQ